MATDVQRQNAVSYGIRFAIKTALLLLGLYIAVFLVMAAMVHVMTSYDASAEIGLPADLLTPDAASVPSYAPLGVAGSPLRDSPLMASGRMDNSRECMPSAGIDSSCIYN